MTRPENVNALAVKVARLYHYQGLTTERIASELGLSRSKISRLLTHARKAGLIEIRVHDPEAQPQELERQIQDRFHLAAVRVVTVPLNSTEDEWLKSVAIYAAKHINSLIHSEMIVGSGMGDDHRRDFASFDAETLCACRYRAIERIGNVYGMSNFYISDIYTRFALNYGGRAHLFPVPAFFDHRESKQAMWKERSVQRIKEMASKADLLIYSIGSPDARIPSYVHAGGFLEPNRYCRVGARGSGRRYRNGLFQIRWLLRQYSAQRARERTRALAVQTREACALHRLRIGQGGRSSCRTARRAHERTHR